MRILLSSLGTRGDMEPFLAIGEILAEDGHEIECLFPEQFSNLAAECGFKFHSLGPEFIDLLNSDIGKRAMGGKGNFFQKGLAYIQLAKISIKLNKKMYQIQHEIIQNNTYDRIIHHPKSLIPILKEIQDPGKQILVSPVPYLHRVKGHSHLAFRAKNYGSWLNELSYKLGDFGIEQTIKSAAKSIGIKQISTSTIRATRRNTKSIYTISPSLFPRPEEWPENFQVLGFHERNKEEHFSPTQALEEFLEQHNEILFITFGSMTNPKPEYYTREIIQVLEDLGIPTILNTFAGGLKVPEHLNEAQFHITEQIPYDWLFPKVSAIIHHGGSGTTHMALKYGKPNLIVPHIIDQFLWNNINHAKGSGPKGMPISKLNRAKLKPLIQDLWYNKDYAKHAEELGKAIRGESTRLRSQIKGMVDWELRIEN